MFLVKWVIGTQNIQKALLNLQDLQYRDFYAKLMPTVDKELIIGVRVPALRKLAKEIFKSGTYKEFLNNLPHRYFEENNLHAFLIMQIKDFDECMAAVERFLPYIDNWATCDGFKPKAFQKHPEALLEKIKVWITSDKTYTIRFAVSMLMTHFLEDTFKTEYADMVAHIKSEEYYVGMMAAWYFATALAKQYDKVIRYIENEKLSTFVHHKTIQKALESDRITDEQKEYLKKYKR